MSAIVKVLNSLIHLDFDAIRAYEAAVKRLDDHEAASNLADFQRDHERHVEVLQQHVRNLGGEPADGADVMRVLTEGMVVLRGGIEGDHGIMSAMKLNEDKTNAAYEAALKTEGLSTAVRATLTQNLGDERRHRAWIVAHLESERYTAKST